MEILIIGGNRFFGKKLARKLLTDGHKVSLFNRGNQADGLGPDVRRFTGDRRDRKALETVARAAQWDVVFDQVCFEAVDARLSCELFAGQTQHYVFTSTQSVYDLGGSLAETAFNGSIYEFKKDTTVDENYGEAKRQCEAVFFQQTKLPVTAVRFPLVLGSDDYTGRLKFHIDHIVQQKSMFFPNPNARHCFMNSDIAAGVLSFLSTKRTLGAFNAAAPDPLRMSELLTVIENIVGKKAILNEQGDPSPYGIENDWFMTSEKLKNLGFVVPGTKTWLPGIVRELSKA